MAPNTRRFLFGSALVVAAGLCTGLVAYYSGVLPSRQVVRGELAFIPADVAAVAYADVRQIMDSEFRQRLRSALPAAGSEKDRMLEATGIDIERDIDAVVAGLQGDGTPGGIAILRGRFDRSRIEAAALQHGAVEEQYGGYAMLVGRPHTFDDGTSSHRLAPSVAFLGDGLLGLGDADELRRAIDVSVSGESLSAAPDMMRLIDDVSGTGDAWFVARVARMTRQPGLPEQVQNQLAGVEWLAASANIDRSVRGRVRAEARDDRSAEDLRAVVNGAVAAARLFAGQDKRVTAALNSLQASGSGRQVELAFELPPSLLELLEARAAAAMSPGPAAGH